MLLQLLLTSIKDLSQWATLLSGNASNTEEELSAVKRVRVLGESSSWGVSGTDKLLSLINWNGAEAALWHLTDPETGVALSAVGQARGTLISVGLAILTLPEDTTVLQVSIGAPEPGTVGGGDGWLQLSPLSTLHQVELLTLLQLVLLISVNEGQSIATGPQLSNSIKTGPVLVTAEVTTIF